MAPTSGAAPTLEAEDGLCLDPSPSRDSLRPHAPLLAKVSSLLQAAPRTTQGHWIATRPHLPRAVPSLCPGHLCTHLARPAWNCLSPLVLRAMAQSACQQAKHAGLHGKSLRTFAQFEENKQEVLDRSCLLGCGDSK